MGRENPLVILRRVGLTVERPTSLRILNPVDLTVLAGTVTAIMGPSGAGKSTLASIIGALQPPSEGSYLFRGAEIACLSHRKLSRFRAENLGFVFQNSHMLEQRTAIANVDLGIVDDTIRDRDRRSMSMNALERVGLEKVAERSVTTMSGGERHRVAIARALVKAPALLIADEPTAALDQATGQDILDLLDSTVRDLSTLIVVTHDQRAAEMADEIVDIVDGSLLGVRKGGSNPNR